MADSPVRNIRDALRSIVPNWLSDRPGFNVGFRVLYVIALFCDKLVEVMLEGARAPLPGVGDPSALPYIGRTRGLIRGLTESDDEYAARLRAWLQFWENAGGAEQLVSLVQTFLGGGLVVRLISRDGRFVTANFDGSAQVALDGSWDWDSGLPERAGWWGDMWLVVYLTDGRYPVYANLSDAAWLAAWGTYQGFGAGMQVTRDVVDGVASLLASFKGAHTWLSAIIWTTDTNLFTPGSLGGIPAGQFGNWSHDVATEQVPARLTVSPFTGTLRYWIPRFGG
jgi:hypothetical protein